MSPEWGLLVVVQLGWGWLWPEQDPGGTLQAAVGEAGGCDKAFGMVQWGVRGLVEGMGL